MLRASPESSEHEVSEDENDDDDDDMESEAASETSHSNDHEAPAEGLGVARPTSSPNSSPEKLEPNLISREHVNGYEATETSQDNDGNSDSYSDEDDEEPVFKYERLRGDAQELLERDNASALAVSLRLMVRCL